MATNPNQVGVVAQFDIQQFVKNQQVYVQVLNKTNADTDKFYKQQQSAAAQAQKAQSTGLQQIRKNFLSYAAEVTAVVGTLVIAYRQLKEAANFRAMIISGENLATSYGVNFQAMLDGLDEVARGALSLEQRVLIANRAMIAGGADFADKVPQLYKIAAAAARATGQDVGFVFETLTRGIAKASPLLIDNAELYLKIGGAVDEYARKLGKSTEELTAQERQVAVLNAVLEQGSDLVTKVGDNAGTVSIGFKQVDTSIADLKVTIGILATEMTSANDLMKFMSDGLVALRQTAIMAAGGFTFIYEILKGIQQEGLLLFGAKAAISLAMGGGLGAGDIARKALEKSNEIMLAASGVSKTEPGAVAAGAQATALAKANAIAAAELEKRTADLKKYNDKIQDLQIKAGESVLEAEKDYQNKSAKAWKDYIEKANEIVADGIKERAKIQRAYSDKIVEAERSYQRGIENANYDHGQKMADIERDYQDTIRNIQQTYREDALDAIRNLDAIALIRAREKRDKDLASANQDRDKQISSEQENYARSIAELSRALADKREEAERDRQRDLDEQRQNEKEKLDEAKRAYGEQTAAIQQAFNDRIAAIRGNYSQEDVEAQAHYLNQQTMLVNHLNAMRSIMAQYGMGSGVTSPVRTPRGGFRRAEGGVDIVNTPTQFTAGEAGPELAIFAPLNRALPSPIMQTVNHTGDFSHSIDAAITSSVAGLDGRIIAVVRKALSEVIR